MTEQAELTDFEIDVLRHLRGEDIPGLIGGAAINAAAASLKHKGYAEGLYRISAKGQQFLQERNR